MIERLRDRIHATLEGDGQPDCHLNRFVRGSLIRSGAIIVQIGATVVLARDAEAGGTPAVSTNSAPGSR